MCTYCKFVQKLSASKLCCCFDDLHSSNNMSDFACDAVYQLGLNAISDLR